MARRQVTIFINGKEVEQSIKGMASAKRRLINELRNLDRSTGDYEKRERELLGQLKKVNGELDTYNAKLKQTSKTTSNADSALGKMVKGGMAQFAAATAGVFAVQKVVEFGTELFKLGTEMEVMARKAQTVFGEALPQVTAQAEKNAAAMGFSVGQYIDASAAIGDLLVPMGFLREEAAGVSTNLVDLSGALSEWTGGQRSATEVSEILGKAILGEREGLKQLGISISQADVDARLLEKGLKGLTGQMLEQAKAAATLELITEKSGDAQAAFAANSETLIRKQAELRAATQEIRESLAQALIPVFQRLTEAVVPVVTGFSKFIQNLTSGEKATGRFSGFINLMITAFRNVGAMIQFNFELFRKFGGFLLDNFGGVIEFIVVQLAQLQNVSVGLLNGIASLLNIEVRFEKINIGDVRQAFRDIKKEREASGVDKPIAPPVLANPSPTGGGGGGDAKADQARAAERKKQEDHFAKLAETAQKFQREQELAQLTGTEREAAIAVEKYDKLIEEARTFGERGIELERQFAALRDQELEGIALKQSEKEREAQEKLAQERIAFQQELQLLLAEEQEKQLLQLDLQYQQLLEKAQGFGLDTSDITTFYEQEKTRILQEEADKRSQAAQEEADERFAIEQELQASLQELEQAKLEIASAFVAQFSQLAGDNAELQTSLFFFEKGLAAAQVILELRKQIALINTKYAAIPFGGVALAAAEIAKAKISAGISLASIAGATVARFVQRAEGGWLDAVGADDGRSYRAQLIGQPGTGLLPNHPVLLDSATGQRVLASERGSEYFVSNKSLRNPAVLDYVRAIDNIQRRTPQFQEGGFTSPSVAAAAPAGGLASAEALELARAVQQLNAILQSGIFAIIDDDTIIDLRKRTQRLNRASGDVL